jgi:predicted RNase H-like nuclease (RuvC/YqgF family)
VRSIGALLTSVLLAACSTINPPPPHTPYFPANGNDSKWQGLLRKESPLASKCASKNTCDHVFFTQALAALYESRESAVRYFEKVIAVAPKGQLAASSRLWLRLLHSGEAPVDQSWLRSILTAPATAEHHTLLSQAIERAVHDLLDRELTIQQLRAMQDLDAQSAGALQRELQDQEKRAESFNSRRDSARMPVEPAALQNLQRQLSDRDKKIEELSGQLEALKRIDQEMREKTRPIKPPSNVLPLQPSEPSKP